MMPRRRDASLIFPKCVGDPGIFSISSQNSELRTQNQNERDLGLPPLPLGEGMKGEGYGNLIDCVFTVVSP